jgi:DNA polymerase-3 subunit delta
VYVLFGADSASADELIRELKQTLVQPGLEAFDFEMVHADELDVTILIQHMRQPPVASKRRLVVVRAIDRLEKEPLKALLAGLAALPDACAVAVTCDYSKSMQAALKSAGLERFVVNLRQPDSGSLAGLIQRRSKELGITLEPRAVQLLVEISGDETTLLLSELDKLATVIDEGDVVTADDVRKLAGQSRQFDLNEYVGKVVSRDTTGALRVLERLKTWGVPPVKIIGWLVTAFLGLAAQGEGQARRCLLRLYEINRDIMRGHPEPFALLEVFTACSVCSDKQRRCEAFRDDRPPALCMWGGPRRAARRSVTNAE